jgi:hypothetical protein
MRLCDSTHSLKNSTKDKEGESMHKTTIFPIASALLILGGCGSSPAKTENVTQSLSPDWVFVSSQKGVEHYINTKTMKKEGQSVLVWNALNQPRKKTLSDGTSYQSYASLEQHDCQENRYRLMSMHLYSGPYLSGSNIFSMNDPKDKAWRYPIPGSVGEKVLNRVCVN